MPDDGDGDQVLVYHSGLIQARAIPGLLTEVPAVHTIVPASAAAKGDAAPVAVAHMVLQGGQSLAVRLGVRSKSNPRSSSGVSALEQLMTASPDELVDPGEKAPGLLRFRDRRVARKKVRHDPRSSC